MDYNGRETNGSICEGGWLWLQVDRWLSTLPHKYYWLLFRALNYIFNQSLKKVKAASINAICGKELRINQLHRHISPSFANKKAILDQDGNISWQYLRRRVICQLMQRSIDWFFGTKEPISCKIVDTALFSRYYRLLFPSVWKDDY